MSRFWSIDPKGHSILINDAPAIIYNDCDYAIGSYERLAAVTGTDVIDMIHEFRANEYILRSSGWADPDWPSRPNFVAIDHTALEYFEHEVSASRAIVRRDIVLAITADRSLFVNVTIHRNAADLTWPEMESLLAAWAAERKCR